MTDSPRQSPDAEAYGADRLALHLLGATQAAALACVQAMHSKLSRDDDGKPVDAVHIHSYADRDVTKKIEQAIWDELGLDEPVPEALGMITSDTRDEPLALTQLILLYHLIQARQSVPAA